MADIITRLLLDTKNFDAKLEKSKSSVNSFQSGIGNMANTARAGVLKFAGAIGVAVGASEAFVKTINSTQTTGDAWVKMQDQMKASVDSFFASIAMGNFDGFLSNLQNVIDKAGDLSTALDNLGTKTLFNNSEVNDLNAKYQIELNKAKSRNLSDKERNEHLQKAKGYLIEMVQLQSSLATANKDTSYIALQADMAKQGFNRNISREVWEYLLKDSNRADVENKASGYKKNISNYENRISKSQKFDAGSGEWVNTSESDRLKVELNKFKNSASGKFGEMATVFLELADDEKSAINSAIKMRSTANSLNVAISQRELEIANTDAKINGSYNSQNGKGSVNTAPPPVGSIADLDKQISEKNQELINATTVQARIAVQTTINELEARKINLQIETNKGAFAAKYGENKLSQISSSEIAGISYNKGKDFKKDLKGELPKYEPIFNKKDIKLNEDYAESLSAIGGMMGNLSGLFDESTASALQWGTSLLTTISQAIPAIIGMMGVKEQDTATTNANTTAEVANAGAKAMSAHSGIPFVGIALGLAGVAAIIAAMASIPQFATGGIVPGTSFTGDKVPALLNSGEMILNGSQQNNLFRLLNSGMSDSLGAKIAPFAGSNEIRLSSDIAIKGDTLYLALNNYMKRTGKRL